MKEDETRLTEIRKFSADRWQTSQHDVRWLVAKYDEEERARTEAEQRAALNAGFVHNLHTQLERAEAALAEERAKRETLKTWSDEHMDALRDARDKFKGRAETAEARVAELERERRTEG